MQLPPLISLDLNESTKSLHNTNIIGVYAPNSGSLNNFVIEKIISVTNGHDSDPFKSFLDSFYSDVELNTNNESSSDSCVSNSNAVSKSTLVPIKLHFKNPSVEQTSKSSSDSQKEPRLKM